MKQKLFGLMLALAMVFSATVSDAQGRGWKKGHYKHKHHRGYHYNRGHYHGSYYYGHKHRRPPRPVVVVPPRPPRPVFVAPPRPPRPPRPPHPHW